MSQKRTIFILSALALVGAGWLALRPGTRLRRAISHITCSFVCTRCNVYAPIDFDIEFYGFRYRGRTDNLIDAQILQYGAFEKPILYFSRDVAKSLGPAGIYVDVGANVGQHSLFMSKYVEKVLAFEPYPPVLDRFRSLVSLNSITNIEIHPVGLGDRSAELPFFEPPDENLGVGSFIDGFAPDNSGAGGLKLKIVTGDEELSNLEAGKIVLIKIDIEGFEKPALHGLSRTLAAHRPVVSLELNINPESEISFHSGDELKRAFPSDYEFLTFDKERSDRVRGIYETADFVPDFSRSNQTEIIAFPTEKADRVPRSNRDLANARAALEGIGER